MVEGPLDNLEAVRERLVERGMDPEAVERTIEHMRPRGERLEVEAVPGQDAKVVWRYDAGPRTELWTAINDVKVQVFDPVGAVPAVELVTWISSFELWHETKKEGVGQ